MSLIDHLADELARRYPTADVDPDVLYVQELWTARYDVLVRKEDYDNGKFKSLKDLKGKGFATQVKGNTGELIARHVLKVSGYTYSDVKASFTNSYTDSVEQVQKAAQEWVKDPCPMIIDARIERAVDDADALGLQQRAQALLRHRSVILVDVVVRGLEDRVRLQFLQMRQ